VNANGTLKIMHEDRRNMTRASNALWHSIVSYQCERIAESSAVFVAVAQTKKGASENYGGHESGVHLSEHSLYVGDVM
jgi:hypothetical protein